MPGLLQQRIPQFPHAAAVSLASNNAIWSRHRDDITSDQLQKFWSDLPVRARQELLKIDKQSLFEQARKNLYCSRCNGLLLEGFTQIVMYGKSLQQESAGVYGPNRTVHSKVQNGSESDDAQDPSVHPWGGLTTTRDGILTLLDYFINAKSLKALQNVFNNARARERERELLYPDACGGGDRGWMMASYGRGHGTRETCALHTAKLSCDTLVDFWSALSDETRSSLLRMKEEDFIERLMYRFDSKRFCRDCRRNVIREFKELKELKRMRREPRCSSWFCVADTAFQYEVSEDTVEADWHQSFTESVGTYHHFEWAIGTGEGKSDILDFEDVGMNGKVHMNGLDLGGLSACFITLRAWKLDGRCTELCVKAHALKGQPCVHRRLIVGDGFVTITKGESIRRFFEHAEEVEEEEDDDAMDKDGSEYDGDGSRPQKHAKSPELAREFLLDAATVIFKEQVEKAFREGTARQNAHSIFVCLSLKLLEDRIHVACKEIITLEKQTKLLEEEEKEKREEEERKERRRTKEREKKFRRKERLKGKDREKERKLMGSSLLHFASPASNDSSTSTHDDSPNSPDSGDSISEAGDIAGLFNPISPDSTNEQSFDGCANSNDLKSGSLWHQCHVDEELNSTDGNGSFILEQSKSSRKKLRFKKDSVLDQVSNWYDDHCSVLSDESSVQHDESDRKINAYTMASSRCIKGALRSTRDKVAKTNTRTDNLKFCEKFHCSNSRTRDRYDFQSCSCNKQGDHRTKDEYHNPTVRSGRVIKSTNKVESSPDMPRPLFRSSKYNHTCYVSDSSVIPRGKLVLGAQGRDVHIKQVWEPTDVRKKCARSNFDPDVTSRAAVKKEPSQEVGFDKDEHQCEPNHNTLDVTSAEFSRNSCEVNTLSSQQELEESRKGSNKSDPDTLVEPHNGFVSMTKPDNYSKNDAEEAESCPLTSGCPTLSSSDHAMSTSSSDNCSSCLSEADSSTSSSIAQNAESSLTSDSEDASQQSDGRYVSTCNENTFHTFSGDSKSNEDVPFTRTSAGFLVPREEPTSSVSSSCNGRFGLDISPSQQHVLPMHDQIMHVPVFPSATTGNHNPSSSSWSTTSTNGLMPFPQNNHYVVPSPFGFSLPANHSPDFQMHYNTVQPLAIPLLSLRQHSLYQTANRAYVTSTQDKIKNSNVSGSQQINGASDQTGSKHPLGVPCPNRQFSSKPPSVGQNGSVGSAAKRNGDIPSFSLFHFGGPMAGAAGYNVNPVSLKEANIGGFESNLPEAHTNLTCSKEDTTIEEYSLFSASTGARFSFF